MDTQLTLFLLAENENHISPKFLVARSHGYLMYQSRAKNEKSDPLKSLVTLSHSYLIKKYLVNKNAAPLKSLVTWTYSSHCSS
jgi:hypothetical protein